MRRFAAIITAVALTQTASPPANGAEDPAGYWRPEQAQAILASTRRVDIAPDLGSLSPAARAALGRLLQAGAIMQELYEDANHREALAARTALAALPADARRAALEDLYYLFRGPIATTLENAREPFLPVSTQPPGRNVYPWGLERAELDAFMAADVQARGRLLATRSVVRRTTADNLAQDRSVLAQHPLLAGLHPGLDDRLADLVTRSEPPPFYALPYSVRWPGRFLRLYALLDAAADDLAAEDPDFSAYLRLRARDLLTDDYEAGDAAWVTGRFGTLNAQIGSYETYDDALYGVKSFFSLSLLVRDADKSRELAAAIGGIQSLQDALPQARARRVREDISVGVYNVVADFGQARGANTATILPNEAAHARKYGRTILLRYNIMTDPGLFADSLAVYQAALLPAFAEDLTLDGNFYRTLWHEIGHYLGVDRTDDERDLGEALAPWGDSFEEMKSDLVSLYASTRLHGAGLLDDETLRSIRASGVRRVLQRVRPRPDQAYGMMQLMQMNFFLEQGLLRWHDDSGRLAIDYDRYQAVVADLLGRVLAIQAAGDAAAAAAFIDRYGGWEDDLHDRLATRLRSATPYRYRMVRYEALARK